MIALFTEHIITIVVAVIGGGAWLFERRQRDASAKVTEGDALSSMQLVYDKFVQDSDERYNQLKAELAEIKVDNYKLEARIEVLLNRCKNCSESEL